MNIKYSEHTDSINHYESTYYSLLKFDFNFMKNSEKIINSLEIQISKLIFEAQNNQNQSYSQLNKNLKLKKFFVITCKTFVYVILMGTMILVDGWDRQIEKFFRIYIQKNLDFTLKNNFVVENLTYLARNKEIKPRRLRSIGGALRRIIKDIKEINMAKSDKFKDIKFYAIKGDIEKLKTVFLAVKTNKKIPNLQKKCYVEQLVM